MRWINSTGGPLIVLNAGALRLWRGSKQDDINRTSDYARACAVPGYVGVISVGSDSALVLADEPLQTSWLPRAGTVPGWLVRWRYAPNEASVEQQLSEVSTGSFHKSGVTWEVASAPQLLTDSSLGADELVEHEALELFIPPGSYSIETAEFEPNPRLSLLIHRLVPCTD